MDNQHIKEYFPKRLRQLRKDYFDNCTQMECAKKLGVQYRNYQSYEEGRALPNFETMLKMATAYEFKTVDEFVLGRNPDEEGCKKPLQLAYLKLKPQQKKIVDYILYENC